MRDKLNCPNCGAVITEAICPYCGTIFYDFANIEIGKEAALRLKIGDNLNIFKAVATSIDVRNTDESHVMYCDDRPFAICTAPEYELTLTMRIVPDERGIVYTKIKQMANLDNFSNPEEH